MKHFLLAVLVCCNIVAAAAQSTGIYVGGHIRRERPATISTLKHSGFTYVILFNVNVEPDGTLTTDGETICRDGEYVFADTQPNYVADVTSLKDWPTSIERIEICIGGWGNESYQRIKDLIAKEGFGSGSMLYRNFKALKDALPVIDAVNNDDEHCYDVSSAVRFHVMMSQLGYHTTVAPYTNRTFWQDLVTQLNQSRPGACDRVLIQCYDGSMIIIEHLGMLEDMDYADRFRNKLRYYLREDYVAGDNFFITSDDIDHKTNSAMILRTLSLVEAQFFRGSENFI